MGLSTKNEKRSKKSKKKEHNKQSYDKNILNKKKRKHTKKKKNLKGGGTLIDSDNWKDRALKSIDFIPDDENIADKIGLDPFPRPDCTIL
jgi:hypothetical protein